ncbi:MAG: PD-(D/E)XK nuclease family protein [Methylococcaceae bacterium]
MQNAKQLLSDVSERLEIFEDTQKKAGERFNIFSITDIERREVKHSAMIAELLKPQGRHGQGDKFLIEFLKIVMPTHPFTGIEKEKAKISTEKSFAGFGKVDILIVLDNHAFIIENKIDALDGDRQLERYKKILDTYFKGKTGHLIYLTKYGSEAKEDSHCGVDYLRISYKNHILTWLNSCIDTLKMPQKVEYALKQYQDLIKKITGQSMTHELKNELVEILMQGDNLKSAQEISKIIWKVQGKILFNFFEELKTKFGHVSVSGLNEYDKKNCELWFHPKPRKKQNDIGFCFSFDTGASNILFRIEVAAEALHYGIVSVKKNDDNDKYEYEFISNSKILVHPFDKLRDGRKWASKIHLVENSYSVFNDANLIRGENETNFIVEVENEIDELRKIAEIK